MKIGWRLIFVTRTIDCDDSLTPPRRPRRARCKRVGVRNTTPLLGAYKSQQPAMRQEGSLKHLKVSLSLVEC